MKYNFKVDKVYKDIERGIFRFLNEYAPGYKLIVPVTDDPCSIVAAWLIDRLLPKDLKEHEIIYIKNIKIDPMSEVEQLMLEKFEERFEIIDMAVDYPSFGRFYGELLGDNTITTLRIQNDALVTFLISEYSDVKPVIVSAIDIMRNMYKIENNRVTLKLFSNLCMSEIFDLGQFLGLKKNLLNRVKKESDTIQRFIREIGIDIFEHTEDFRAIPENRDPSNPFKDTVLESPYNKVMMKYTPPVMKAENHLNITNQGVAHIQTQSLYDVYED